MNESQIIVSFGQSLFDSDFKDIVEDFTDVSFEEILDNEIFSCIPIVRTAVAFGKTAYSFYQKNALQQTFEFIKTFNSRTISRKRLSEYREKINENQKFREQELGRVLVLLEKNVDIEKSKILACLYGGYINGDIDWDKFCELSDLNSRMFVSDIPLLFDIVSERVKDTTQCTSYQVDRLISLGLVSSTPKTIYPSGVSEDRYVSSTELGKIYCGLSKDVAMS